MIETPRMQLVLLNGEQLSLWLCDLPAVERALLCRYDAEPVEGGFREVIKAQCALCREKPEQTLYSSFFWMIRKSDRVVVGSLDFKNPPDDRGAVEIGYGLGAAYRGEGYMTEAVSALCDYAFTVPEIRLLWAQTDSDNNKSQAVLVRCGFEPVNGEVGQIWQKAALRAE